MSFFSARFIRSFAGSDPLFNIKTQGVKFENFLCINSKLKIEKQVKSTNFKRFLEILVIFSNLHVNEKLSIKYIM